ncbi:unnamed protein product [Pleuronectes platessa]|uniref:Uncharacterized protein n=1 Tax=Pleuronectes platessa TaxID=8262 RepID=A0A9N7YXR4_PLEPL|nr:unnamed protein product [Pleuronectes platessa]
MRVYTRADAHKHVNLSSQSCCAALRAERAYREQRGSELSLEWGTKEPEKTGFESIKRKGVCTTLSTRRLNGLVSRLVIKAAPEKRRLAEEENVTNGLGFIDYAPSLGWSRHTMPLHLPPRSVEQLRRRSWRQVQQSPSLQRFELKQGSDVQLHTECSILA